MATGLPRLAAEIARSDYAPDASPSWRRRLRGRCEFRHLRRGCRLPANAPFRSFRLILQRYALDVEQIARRRRHRLAVEKVVGATALHPSHLAGWLLQASFRDDLMAVIVVNSARHVPAADMILGPAQALVNPAFPMVR